MQEMAANVADGLDWSVTDAKVEEAVRRIVATANPLRVVLFGSRARGDFRPDSDVDLAVILEGSEEDVARRIPYGLLWGIRMEVDLVVVSEGKYDLHRPWINSIFNYIDREGIVLYDRRDTQSADRDAAHAGGGGRVDAAVFH